MAETSSYYDKVFRKPEYIWNSGACNLDLIASTIEEQHVDRLRWLAGTGSIRIDLPVTKKPDGQGQQLPTTQTPVQNNPSTSESKADSVTSNSNLNASPAKPGASRNVVVPLLSLVWNGAEPQNYQAQFRIGTEPVPFLLDLDTGSSLLWVQSRLTETDPGIPDQSQYNPTLSKTSKGTNEHQNVNYGDGSSVEATLFTDNVRIEKLLAEDQSIGAVSSTNLSQDAIKGKSNGLIGLGFAKVESTGFVQTLKREDAIRYASITLVGPRNNPEDAKKIDETQTMEPRGHLIVGSVDEKFYTGKIAWCPQIPGFDAAVADRWIVKLDAILLNGTEILELKDQYALIDTGTSYIVTSPSNMTTFRHQIKGARPTKKLYMWAYPKTAVTSISFKLGGRTIELHPGDFSLGDLDPDPEGVVRSVSSICTLPNNTWPFSNNLWILGGIFIDNVVTIFDFGEKKVGFADISERDLAQDVDTTS